jgi:hypothetical protein
MTILVRFGFNWKFIVYKLMNEKRSYFESTRVGILKVE